MRGVMRSDPNGGDYIVRGRFEKVTGLRLTREVIRLLPYIQYVLMNEQRFDRAKVSQEEHTIIRNLIEKGCLLDHNGRIRCSLEFWISLNEVLYLSYVDYEENE